VTTTEDEGTVLQLAGADSDRDKTNDHVPFQLGDDETVYHGRRPKMAILLKVAAALDDDSNPMAQAMAFDRLIEKVLEPDSAAALRERLEDEDDDLDLDSPGIQSMFQTLMGLWYGGPTGKRPASRGSRPRTGRRSTVRARSGG
jgi:hypothetical protein